MDNITEDVQVVSMHPSQRFYRYFQIFLKLGIAFLRPTGEKVSKGEQ